MNKNIKLVLNYINKYNSIKNYELVEKLPITNEELVDTLDYLKFKRIIDSELISEWENGFIHQNKYFYSTLISKNYYKIKFKKLFFKCFRNFLIHFIFPITIAYITAIIAINNNECCTNSNSNGTKYTQKP